MHASIPFKGLISCKYRKHVSIATSRSLYAISNYFVQLVRKVVSHAVNQH